MRICASTLVGFAGSAMMAAMFVMSGCGGDDSRPTVDGGNQGGSSAATGGTTSAETGGTSSTAAGGTTAASSTTAAPYVCKKGAVTEAKLAPGKNGTWGSTIGIVGGTFNYANADADKLSADIATTPGQVTLTGTIGTNSYAGYGLYFKDPDKCFDIGSSEWKTGIRITIGGTLGEAKLSFQLQQNDNYPIADGKGACTGTWSSGCGNNTTTLTITDTVAPIDIKWTDLAGGSPVSEVKLDDVLGFQLHVDCPQDASASCPVSLTVGEITLY